MLVSSGRECILLLTPDAMVRHLGVPIMARVAEAGFQVRTHRLLWTPPGRIGEFHDRHETVAADPALQALAQMLFELGPTLVAVLALPGVDDATVYGRLRALKGRGDPAYAEPGSLRHDFGAVNTILNLVHTTESEVETRRERKIFLRGHDSAGHDLASTLAMVERVLPKENRSYGDVLAGVRRKVLAALWDRLAPHTRQEVSGWLDRTSSWFVDRRFAEALDVADKDDLLVRLLDTDYTPGAGVAWPEHHRILTDHGVQLDRWECLVLATSLSFASLRGRRPNPRRVPVGTR